MDLRKALVGLLLAGGVAPALSQDLNQGLVAYWPFEGTVEDASPGNHDGVASGGPGYLTGRVGQALRLDGVNDSVAFASVPNAAFAGDFSIAYWVRFDAVRQQSVVGKRAACNIGNQFDLRTGVDAAQGPVVGFTLQGQGQNPAPIRPYVAGQWIHVVAVRQGSVARLYTDGEACPDVALPTLDFSQLTAPFAISASPCIGSDGTFRLAGEVDELRLYNRALSPAEAAELAGGTTLATEAQLREGLVAHFPFEFNLRDLSGADRDGTAAGSPEYAPGVVGRAISLDGLNDAATFAAIPASTFAGNLSLSWWMRLPTLAPYALFGKRQACSVSDHFDIRMRSNPADALGFELSRPGSNAYAFGMVPQDAWVHVTAVRQGGFARLYMDGQRGPDVALPTLDLGSVTAPFGLGTSPCIAFGDGTLRPRGRVDDLRV